MPHIKFQDSSISGSRVSQLPSITDRQTDGRTDGRTDRPKPICPLNFSEVGGIKIHILSTTLNNLGKYGLVKATSKLENVFMKHYAPNHMPDPKGEWTLKENNSELHHGIYSKVNQFIYTLVCNYMPNIRIQAKAVLQIFHSQGCPYT